MAEGLKLVNEIYKRGKEQHSAPEDSYLGIDVAVLVLSDPRNSDLWSEMVEYCEEEHVTKEVPE